MLGRIGRASGNAYVRIGDEKHKLSIEEIRELQIDKGQGICCKPLRHTLLIRSPLGAGKGERFGSYTEGHAVG
jgi:hypothetical protein